jgi:hypothetical protein
MSKYFKSTVEKLTFLFFFLENFIILEFKNQFNMFQFFNHFLKNIMFNKNTGFSLKPIRALTYIYRKYNVLVKNIYKKSNL